MNIQQLSEDVQSMIDQEAPESDIVDYLDLNGYTPERYMSALSRLKQSGGRVTEGGPGRAALQGALWNFSDEAEAFLKHPLDSRAQDQEAAAIRGGLEDYRHRHPNEAMAAELGGAIGMSGLLALLTGGASTPATAARVAPYLNMIRTSPVTTGAATGLASGAVSGFGAGEGSISNRLQSAGTGAAFGGALGGAIPGLPAAARAIGNVAAPYLEKGRRAVAGDVLRNAATDPNRAIQSLRQNASELVPGSLPMTGEVSQDVGLAALQNPIANTMDEASALTNRTLSNSDARTRAFADVAKDPAALERAVIARDLATDPLREAVFRGASPANASRILDSIEAQLKRPENVGEDEQKILTYFHDRITEFSRLIDPGDPAGARVIHPESLYRIRKDMGKAMRGTLKKAEPETQHASGQLIEARAVLDAALEEAAPGFARYLKKYRAMSAPIDQMKLLQDIGKRSETAAESVLGLPIFSQAKMKGALGQPSIIKKLEILTDEQLQTVEKVMRDLDRSTAPRAASIGGSQTAKNLTTANIIGQIFGEGMASTALGLAAQSGPLRWLTALPEHEVRRLMVDAMLNPKLAADLMEEASVTASQRASQQLKRLARARGIGLASGNLAGSGANAD